MVLWGREEDTEPQGQLLEALNMPFVVKGRHEIAHPHWQQVDFDHERMTRLAFDHLVDLGHRRIAYLGFPHADGFVQALRSGFLNAHSLRLGVDADPTLIGEFEDEVEPNAEQIRAWLNLPEHLRPTAFVIGAGNKAWQALELCLAEVGRKLADTALGYSAAGITSSPFALMFGDALAYQGIEIDNLARFVTPALIHALDRNKEAECVQRFRPELTPAKTLHVKVTVPLRGSSRSPLELI